LNWNLDAKIYNIFIWENKTTICFSSKYQESSPPLQKIRNKIKKELGVVVESPSATPRGGRATPKHCLGAARPPSNHIEVFEPPQLCCLMHILLMVHINAFISSFIIMNESLFVCMLMACLSLELASRLHMILKDFLHLILTWKTWVKLISSWALKFLEITIALLYFNHIMLKRYLKYLSTLIINQCLYHMIQRCTRLRIMVIVFHKWNMFKSLVVWCFWQTVHVLILHMLSVDWVYVLIILVLSIGMVSLDYWDT
jgi:hypothetical protein